jgi:site-specific recombinase XerD
MVAPNSSFVSQFRTGEKRKLPYWMSRIMQHHIKPVAQRLGIPLKGWRTLRHGCTTLLPQNGSNPKVVQDLLQHASYRTRRMSTTRQYRTRSGEAHMRLVTRASIRTR